MPTGCAAAAAWPARWSEDEQALKGLVTDLSR